MDEVASQRTTDTQNPAALVAAMDAKSAKHQTPCGTGYMVWRRWGAGPPVVLLHGGAGAWSHWVRNIEPLSARHTVWAMDLPGLGESADPQPLSLDAIVDAVENGLHSLIPGPGLISLMGFSFGSGIAGILATRLTGRLRHLVLVGARYWTPAGWSLPDLVSWKGLQDPAARIAAHRRNLEILMIGDPNNIDELAVYLQSTNASRARVSGPRLKPIDRMQACLPHVRALGRVTGISGRYDVNIESTIDKQEPALQASQPGARLHIIEYAGHWVQYEAAERFNELAIAALAD